MGVPLWGGHVPVPEQFLHDTQVRPVVEQVSGKGVAERVGVCGRCAAPVDDPPNIAGGQAVPPFVDEQRR
uniref:Unannotated protein n=1 Tax=freshwater metagenome TaxID=449393 RepID=A0A6J7NBD0_9ZZZZ